MAVPTIVTCPYCTGPTVLNAGPQCEKCRVPHHYECWMENGGCTTFACKNSPDIKRNAQ
jgi:hypothetical protein